jgi:putative oxidoreductase
MKFLTTNAHWLLRLALAGVFIFHGVLKFLNLEGFAQMLPISYLQVVLVALAETGGGILVLAGGFGTDRISDLATRAGAALNIPVIIGAISIVHWGRWNFVPSQSHPMGGFEFQAVLLLLLLYLVITGNTAYTAAEVKITQRNPLPATATAVAG